MPADNNRRGIISVGNWVVDTIKFIDRYPTKGNLTTIARVNEGLGGCAHNVLVDLAKLRSGIPLYAGDASAMMTTEECVWMPVCVMGSMPAICTSLTVNLLRTRM